MYKTAEACAQKPRAATPHMTPHLNRSSSVSAQLGIYVTVMKRSGLLKQRHIAMESRYLAHIFDWGVDDF